MLLAGSTLGSADFDQCSQDLSRNPKNHSKFLGLCKKIQSWFFLAEVAMLRDALGALKQWPVRDFATESPVALV